MKTQSMSGPHGKPIVLISGASGIPVTNQRSMHTC